jgi:poly(3-hydroxybutyrate) depolymerase
VTDGNECNPNPCLNNGTCVDGVGSFTCTCPAGVSGTTCQTDVDECAPNPCQNGGSCTDGTNAFTCTCPGGFNGPTCANDIDECATNNGGCAPTETCVNVFGAAPGCRTRAPAVESAGCNVTFNAAAFGIRDVGPADGSADDVDNDGVLERQLFFDVDGDGLLDREAAVRFPVAFDPNVPHPLVFEFHGDQALLGDDSCAGSNNGTCDEPNACAPLTDATDCGFEPAPLEPSTFTQGIFAAQEYADDQAIVVALRGINVLSPLVRDDFAGFVSWNSLPPTGTNGDVLAVRALRDFVEDNACIDTTRRFAVGFSGGGFFTQSLRCFGEDFAGYAIFQAGIEGHPAGFEFLRDDAGDTLRLDLATCSTVAAPTLIVHGDADESVFPAQGIFAAEDWAGVNGCDALADATQSSLDPDCVEFTGCTGAADVVLCTPAGVDHSVWSPEGSAVLRGFFSRFF